MLYFIIYDYGYYYFINLIYFNYIIIIVLIYELS